MKTLEYKTTKRFVVQGQLVSIKSGQNVVFTSSQRNKYNETQLKHRLGLNTTIETPIKTYGLHRKEIKSIMKNISSLSYQNNQDNQISNCDQRVVCQIKIDDCYVYCDYYFDWHELPKFSEVTTYEIEIFRFKTADPKDSCKSIQLILIGHHDREMFKEKKSPILSTTQDISEALK